MNKVEDIDKNLIVDGFYIKHVAYGFFVPRNVANKMLRVMGLQKDIIPFNIIDFIRKGETYWKDCENNIAYMSFKVNNERIVCFGSYLGEKRTISFIHHLNDKSTTLPARSDSRSIGESCLSCIYNIVFKSTEHENNMEI